MTVIDELNFDAMTDGPVSLTLPWKTAPGGSVPAVSADAAIHGAKGIRWTSTSPYGRVDYAFDDPFTAAVVWYFYFRVKTFATNNHYIAAIADAAGAGQADWRINTARTVSIRNGSTAVATSTESLTVDTAYRVEWKLDPASDTQELRIFAGESGAALSTLTGSYTSGTGELLTVGPSVAATGGAIDYDTLKVADDWVDAEVPPVALTPVLREFRYHDGQWV